MSGSFDIINFPLEQLLQIKQIEWKPESFLGERERKNLVGLRSLGIRKNICCRFL
jgi:hypothetical protein